MMTISISWFVHVIILGWSIYFFRSNDDVFVNGQNIPDNVLDGQDGGIVWTFPPGYNASDPSNNYYGSDGDVPDFLSETPTTIECFENPDLPGCSSCLSPTVRPGCFDTTCMTIICHELNQKQCCTDSWDAACANLAQGVCRPEIIPWPPGIGCPLGFTCEENVGVRRMANCTEIQEIAKEIRVGDIWGGIYCPENILQIQNCKLGKYCPTPTEEIDCKKGYFCPHKTSEPWIRCYGCDAGAEEMVRDVIGYVVLSGALIVGLVAIFMALLKKYRAELFAQQMELLSRQADSLRTAVQYKERQQQLERLRPKLDIIAQRLAKMEQSTKSESFVSSSSGGSASIDTASPPTSPLQKPMRKAPLGIPTNQPAVKDTVAGTSSDGQIKFDAKKLFDLLDADESGDISYEEMNVVLELMPYELQNFVTRMQELGGKQSTETKVTRPVFCRYFLQVLEETKQLTVSPNEAAGIYDSIAAENGRGFVTEAMLYTSSLSNFLSDQQILSLIKKFRAMAVRPMSALSVGNSSTPSRVISRKVTKGPSRVGSLLPGGSERGVIDRDAFIEHYPQFLIDVTMNFDELRKSQSAANIFDANEEDDTSVDICFKNLSLSVSVGSKSINVVDNVTGRLRERTMTALMGGSGAGKTSLLNALCGRAYYGEVHGEIYVNGQLMDIKEIQDSVGFVPQDDIVYAELTVRENLIYTGKFLLPRGTSITEIEELADETIASLGLARVANSLVGDVKRRGVSGGEKKRVNIGLELMKRPACVFLDEPTSGLDASSALLVMQSLKHLVNVQGVTIVSVIHQPRKFIFDLFDSLILLGVGGRMVYHGPTNRANEYFNNLDYILPKGESVADWLIDISSGRLERDSGIAKTKKEQQEKDKKRKKKKKKVKSAIETAKKKKKGTTKKAAPTEQAKEKHTNKKKKKKGENQEPASPDPEDVEESGHDESGHDVLEITVNFNDDEDGVQQGTKDYDVVGKKGVSAGKANDAFEQAKVRRAWLYAQWIDHFEHMSTEERQLYDTPPETSLPQPVLKQPFVSQLVTQVSRALLVSRRNYVGKLIDTAILVIATIVLCLMSGFPEMTKDRNPEVTFQEVVRPTNETVRDTMYQIFRYTAIPQEEFPIKVGIISAVLIGLQATKILTSKRIEFFREASSGFNINAYYAAVNIVATIETTIQIFLATCFTVWIRDPIANWISLFIHFVLLVWVCVSWALLVPMIVPPDNVTVVIGFFMAFCGLLISGTFPPMTYDVIYKNGGIQEHIAAWLSPTRWFFESLIVGELRCMPDQSGWTVEDESVNYPRNYTMLSLRGFAGHDPNATQFSCLGWYWAVWPALFVGLTIRFAAGLSMHAFNRSQQVKKPLLYEMKRDRKVAAFVAVMAVLLLLLGWFTTWLYTYERPAKFETNEDTLAAIDYQNATVQEILDQSGVDSHYQLDPNLRDNPTQPPNADDLVAGPQAPPPGRGGRWLFV